MVNSMGIEKNLEERGYERTENESPFHDDGVLWSNSHELVCDETGFVIDDSSRTEASEEQSTSELGAESVPQYEHSGRVILPGANKGDSFFYESH